MDVLMNAVYGLLGGVARGILAYLKVADVERFSVPKLLQTIIQSAVFGIGAGLCGAGPGEAVASGMLGDQLVNLVMTKRKKS